MRCTHETEMEDNTMLQLQSLSGMNAQVICSLAVLFLAGVLVTIVTKKLHLPDVTGYILAGVLVGPYCLNLVPEAIQTNMEFITDLALGFIAFGVGRYFKLSVWKNNGRRVFVITLFEAFIAAALVTITMRFVFRLSWSFSLLLGAIGSATAPASTIMTIRQYKAKGDFVNTILQVVALDDAVALVAFSVCTAIVSMAEAETIAWSQVLLPVLWNILLLGLGVGIGVVLHKLIDREMPQDRRLVFLITLLLILTAVCDAFDVSPLLACMAMGTAYINCGGKKKTFERVNRFTPAIFLLFFVTSGMRLDVTALKTAGAIGVVYFFVRIVGKYLGAFLGSACSGSPRATRNYLGLALVPQAGVSIGLCVLASRMLPAHLGDLLSTIILSSGILYELVGPLCAKASLFLSGSIAKKTDDSADAVLQVQTTEEPAACIAQTSRQSVG